MSIRVQPQNLNQNQWTNVLQHYGPVSYESSEVSPTNTSMGVSEMRSPPPAYSTTARPHAARRPSQASLVQAVRRNSRPTPLATGLLQPRPPTSTSTTPTPTSIASRRSRSGRGASVSLDENASRSMSLGTNTSTSSSGTDDLDSPPIQTEGESDTAGQSASIRSSTSSRPSMRHFPSVNTLRTRREDGDSDQEDDGEETYPRRMLCRDDLIGKPVAKKYMTARPASSIASSKSKGSLKFDGWWNTSGRKGSRLMSKIKSSGSRLSRLFSSEGESGGSSDGLEEDTSIPRNGVEVTRRPSLTIDLSTVPTFTSELVSTSLSAGQAMEPRVPTPSFVLGRNGFSRYNPLPTIIGSPSIQMSPPEQFYTPSTGLSPTLSSGLPMIEPPRSLVGLFQTPLAVPVLTTRSSEATLVNTASAETSKVNTPDSVELDKALFRLSTNPTSPPLETTELGLGLGMATTTATATDMSMDVDVDSAQQSPAQEEETDPTLSIFSPRIHCKPVLLPVLGSPMCSPLELPSLCSPTASRESIFSTLTLGTGAGAGTKSGLPMSKMGSASRSHSSTGSLRIKIDGNPMSASLTSIAINLIVPAPTAAANTTPESHVKPELKPELQAEADAEAKEEEEEESPAPTPTRSTLTRASVDVNALNPRIPIALPHRPSLPNPSTINQITTPTPNSPARSASAFSPLLGSGSPRVPDSPHFARLDFGPVPTPPSLIANPKSLGDPFPNGVPSSSSRNLAALASAEEMHGLGHLRRRSSGRIIDRYARGPLSPPRKLSPPELQLPTIAAETPPGTEETKTISAAANPYFP